MESENDPGSPPVSANARPPSRIPAVHNRNLSEISENDANVRNGAMSGIPSIMDGGSLKHKLSYLPEPAPKRKTLAERAGEIGNSNMAAPPSSKPVTAAVKVTSVGGPRNMSNGSSGSSTRSASSLATRDTSGSSNGFSVSLGQGSARPKSSAGGQRPISMYSHHKAASSIHESRPAVAVAHLNPGFDPYASQNKRKGTLQFSSLPSSSPSVRLPRQRRRADVQTDNIYSSAHEPPRNPRSHVVNPFRDVSISSGLQNLSLQCEPVPADGAQSSCPNTPSHIPKPVNAAAKLNISSFYSTMPPSRTPKMTPTPKNSPERKTFLSKSANSPVAWDTKSRLENMEQDMRQLYGMKEQIEAATSDRTSLQEQVTFQKLRIAELESIRSQFSGVNEGLQANNTYLQNSNSELQASNGLLRRELDDVKTKLHQANVELDTSRRNHSRDVDDLTRKGKNEVEDMRDSHKRANESFQKENEDRINKLNREHIDALADTEKKFQSELDAERLQHQQTVEELSQELSSLEENVRQGEASKEKELQSVKEGMAKLEVQLEQEKSLNANLREKITESTSITARLESENQSMKAKVTFLESDSQAQSHAFGDLEKRTQEAERAKEEAEAKLRAEETLRRKLHNQVQELKGNIRVFCRVRPFLGSEEDDSAKITYPDREDESKEIMVMGPEQKSSLGTDKTKKNPFAFDRVFGPASNNPEIFDEISQLVQSALDGYNVCIFCYGQTGSGKTYTMSAVDGMIPLAVNQIYTTAAQLEEKGWKYTMEGTFVEIYNENINDLLGRSDDLDKKKHEIRHDDAKGKTSITDVNTMRLDSPATLQTLMDKASKNRSVAATKANERSSRSHSVFILKLTGVNSITGEQSEGVLNLVDLAGSERLAHSGATGERLKETQSINSSLSCLGDVIAALGNQSGRKDGSSSHIPYRNSKLTYLLQHSLGGNSKTLMFVMISPLLGHLSETLTSLKFATKVHNTHIGTAKRQTKVREV